MASSARSRGLAAPRQRTRFSDAALPAKPPASQHGRLAGDAYLFLHAAEATPGGALAHSIAFWLGRECSQDEAGAAAALAVQLDQALGAKGIAASISRRAPLSSTQCCGHRLFWGALRQRCCCLRLWAIAACPNDRGF